MYKKIIVFVSLMLASIGFGSDGIASVPQDIEAKIMNVQESSPLILTQTMPGQEIGVQAWHSSHRSHMSHSSHSSHRSHYSHQSGY